MEPPFKKRSKTGILAKKDGTHPKTSKTEKSITKPTSKSNIVFAVFDLSLKMSVMQPTMAKRAKATMKALLPTWLEQNNENRQMKNEEIIGMKSQNVCRFLGEKENNVDTATPHAGIKYRDKPVRDMISSLPK